MGFCREIGVWEAALRQGGVKGLVKKDKGTDLNVILETLIKKKKSNSEAVKTRMKAQINRL